MEEGEPWTEGTQIASDVRFNDWTFCHEMDLHKMCCEAAELVVEELLKDRWTRLEVTPYEVNGNDRLGKLYVSFTAWDGGLTFQVPLLTMLTDYVKNMDWDEVDEAKLFLGVLKLAVSGAEAKLKELKAEARRQGG